MAHINNKTDANEGYEGIFIPLVKRGLSKMCAGGQYNGNDINDIKRHIDDLYGLEMPDTILKKMLSRIQAELNSDGEKRVNFYSGGSFMINKLVFDDFEEEIKIRNRDLERLQRIYDDFLRSQSIEDGSLSIFDFVEQHKVSLGKYISKKYPMEHEDNTVEARFVNFIKPIEELYHILQSIYIGSIISTYLEYKPGKIRKDVELLLDTNFIISLLDLNTANSTSNCQRMIEIGNVLGYRFSVLSITIKEIDRLLKARVDGYDSTFLSRIVDPEDIYNACERRGLSKTDLDRIRANAEEYIEKFGITIISHTEKYENKAKHSDDYERLKIKRNTPFAALHDITCAEYVKEKRGKIIREFDKVNCWFVNNSSTRSSNYFTAGSMPLYIKAEDLLNLLWLTSPMVKSRISVKDLAAIGLSRLVATTLVESLPSAGMIRELDFNIRKYAKDEIKDEDVLRVSRGIAKRTVTNLDNLIMLADKDKKKFVDTLQSVANEEKEKEHELRAFLVSLSKKLEIKSEVLDRKMMGIDKKKKEWEETVFLNTELAERNNRIQKENIRLKNGARKLLRDEYVRKKVLHWRLRCFWFLPVAPLPIFLFWTKISLFLSQYMDPIQIAFLASIAGVIYSGVFVKIFADRFNSGTVNAFKSNIEIPEDMRPLDD